MDSKIEPQMTVRHLRVGVSVSRFNQAVARLLLAGLLAGLGIVAGASNSSAKSAAATNREGNRLFEEGKYEDAEKAYLEAEVNNPGKPELLYNLGNSLIKQKKYAQALQALQRAASKGNREIRERSWYNAGNAFYTAGKFRDAAQAYVQALRIDPADRDAKHNLELALLKLKDEESDKSSGDERPQQAEGAYSRQQELTEQKQLSQPSNGQTTQSDLDDGSLSKERALQILDALQNQELSDQRKHLERRANRNVIEKDW